MSRVVIITGASKGIGKPEEIGYAAAFLASKRADFITRQSIVVDGGQVLPESHFCEY